MVTNKDIYVCVCVCVCVCVLDCKLVPKVIINSFYSINIGSIFFSYNDYNTIKINTNVLKSKLPTKQTHEGKILGEEG